MDNNINSIGSRITRLSNEDFDACTQNEILPPHLMESIAMENILVDRETFNANLHNSRRTLRSKLLYRLPNSGELVPLYISTRDLRNLPRKIKLSIRYIYGKEFAPIIVVFPFPKNGV